MPKQYECVVHSEAGLLRETIEADDLRAVRAILRERGLLPVNIKEAKKPRRDWVAEIKKQLQPEDSPWKVKRQKAEKVRRIVFYFVAVPSTGGASIRGDISAPNIKAARQLLRDKGLTPVSVEVKRPWHDFLPRDAQASALKLGAEEQRRKSRLPIHERALNLVYSQEVGLKHMVFYTQQMATMMDAGLSISQALDILQGSITHPRLIKINEEVRSRIYEGIGLGEAYGEFVDYIPPVFIEMIAIGELSGNLEETLRRLSEFFEKELDTMGKIRGALSYPAALLALIVLIVIGLMMFVVPSFIELFKEFKLELPLTTRTLLGLSDFFVTKWWSVPIIGFGCYLTFRYVRTTRVGQFLGDHLEYRWPLIGKLRYKVAISRLLHNLALFLRCGVTITAALEQCRSSTSNQIIAFKIEEIRLGIMQGIRFSTLVESSALFPAFVNHLLLAGEEAGAIDELLTKGARYIDREVDGAIKALTAAIEPILTVFIAGIVLFILGSLYMPLMGLMGSGQKAVM